MPRRYRKRAPRKPQGFLQKALPVAKKALKVAKFVAGVINSEYKYFVQQAGLIASTWNGSVINLFTPSQGVGASQRTGDSVKIKDLTIRFEWAHLTAGLPGQMARLIIFWDKQNEVVNAGDFLQNTGTYVSLYSSKQEGNRYNSVTLYDRYFPVNNNDHLQLSSSRVFKINRHVRFAAGSTNAETGALKMIIMCQTPTNGPQFTYLSRVSYVDN